MAISRGLLRDTRKRRHTAMQSIMHQGYLLLSNGVHCGKVARYQETMMFLSTWTYRRPIHLTNSWRPFGARTASNYWKVVS
eukprot:4909033-Amphidinium_carterae.1